MQIIINDHFLGEVVKGTYHGKLPFPNEVLTGFKRRLAQMKDMRNTQDLRNLKSLHFEKLKEKRYEGKYSIRINKAYRIIFGIDKEGGLEIIEIVEINKHYS
ncbi:MAG TPA: type II toxin-antitoxin system RelE/ParE family toxin [Daejeonella sp.]|uniref:type II toxin-antitoxin system RelE/ParE family toxin n=1 Tax=Daejeonella sp. TaxID=2805397 RepID=UPI002ED8E2F8